MVALIMVALAHSALSLKWKRILIYGALIVGLAGFGIRYAKYFQKEHNSIGARFVYWRAALEITQDHPILGTGPGTFAVFFAQIKKPTDEMARLCHNDYLEQACDSGVPGCVAYVCMICVLLFRLYRYRIEKNQTHSIDFAVSLGVLGLCLHSLVEFHLYMPALAWPMFFLLGWAANEYNYR